MLFHLLWFSKEVKQVEGEENIEGDKPGFARRRGTEESQLCKDDSPLEEDQIYLSHALRSNAHTPHADTQACRPLIHARQRNALPLTAAPRSIWIRMICWNL